MSAQTESSGGAFEQSFGEFAASVLEAYQQMETPAGRYVGVIVAPSAVFAVLAVVTAIVVDQPVLVRMPIALLGVLAVVVAVVYPKLLQDQKRKEINDRLHLFVTHMTILSTTNIDRVEVFRILAEEREYRALATEMSRVVQLVDTWNQSLDDACRIRARKVPSKPLSDFLDRLAYTINAGQQLSDFLLSEQGAMIQSYVTIYEGALDNIEIVKDLYLSMILSSTFALVFATVLPILTGTNPTYTVSAVLILFVLVQGGFVYGIRSMAPYDPVWYHPTEKVTDVERRIRISVVAGVLLTVVLIVASLAVLMGKTALSPTAIPLPFYAAAPTTPLLIPGMVIRTEENKIKGRDEEFTNFIRALGGAESAKQSTTSNVLETLRTKDFGHLTGRIDDLYKRLNMRIEPSMAWRHFTADCRSYLIQKFSEMYLIGRQMGGDPKRLGELISRNMNEVIQLREQRKQATVTMIGVLYGITAAATFAFFIGLEIVDILAQMSTQFDLDTIQSAQIIHPEVYDITTIEYLLVIIVLVNATLSSLMVRIIDGGHKVNAYFHFVVLTWTSAAIAVFTGWVVAGFLLVG